MKTLAGIAHALSDNLITRAADVVLKERRRLVLLTREDAAQPDPSAQHDGRHRKWARSIRLRVPAFYNRPASIDAMVDHTVGRVLDLFDIDSHDLVQRWQGLRRPELCD